MAAIAVPVTARPVAHPSHPGHSVVASEVPHADTETIRVRLVNVVKGSLRNRPALAITVRYRTPGFRNIQAVATILRWQFAAIGPWWRSAPYSR